MLRFPSFTFRKERQAELLAEDARKMDIAALEATPRGAEMLALSDASVVVGRLPFLLKLRPEDLRPEGDTLAERLASVSAGGAFAPGISEDLTRIYEAGGYYGRKAALALTRYLQVDAQIHVLEVEKSEGAHALAEWLRLRDEYTSWRNAAAYTSDPAQAGTSGKRADACLERLRSLAVAAQDLEVEDILPETDKLELLEMSHRARTDALHRDLLAVARRLEETVPGFGGRDDPRKALARLLSFEKTRTTPLRPALEDQIRRATQEVRRLGRPLADMVDFSNISTPPRAAASHRSDALHRALDDALLAVEGRQETGLSRTGAAEVMVELRRQALGLAVPDPVLEARARALAAQKTRS